MKLLTFSEAESKRRKAVEFLRRIGNDDLANEFDSMDAADYAKHKGAELLNNPNRRRQNTMATVKKTKAELEAELDEANDYIDQLQGKLDDIAGIAAEGDEAEEGEDDAEEDEGDTEEDEDLD